MKGSLETVDIGVNLAHRSFSADRPAVIQRAFAAGVHTLIITGTSESSSRAAQQIARDHPGRIFSTAGVHPHDSRHCTPDTIANLRRLATLEQVVAIGECGLDFNRDFSPRPQQEQWFAAQVALAEEIRLPLFLHERDACQRFGEILAATRKSVPAVVHCFTGSRAALKAYLDMGLHIGITGWICDERRGQPLRELVREIPLDRLMIETDAPFLLPRSMSAKPKDGRNEPCFLPYVLQAIAECLGKSPDEVARATTTTARNFFQLDRISAGNLPSST
ncbi:MAG TPA: TatD family hydrolase [Verrucomicrobiae bacterium]|nr:TatD family hydrolase [Verrucomicrobiae bacterium]